jgi:hypothetical protein
MNGEIRMGLKELGTGQIAKVSRPLPDAGKLFTLPPLKTRLWKYGDYHKFSKLFSANTLYFRRADKLPDIFEGRFTAANRTRRSDMFGPAFEDLGLGNDDSILHIQESHRVRTFLHCWHKNEKENPRMWREYTKTNESVVLVTNFESLACATNGKCRPAEVHYTGENTPLPELHSLAALVHKRKTPYYFENELRLLYELGPEESVYLDHEEDFFRLIAVNSANFVHEVRFHPLASPEFKAKVRAEIDAAHLCLSVRDSSFVHKWWSS